MMDDVKIKFRDRTAEAILLVQSVLDDADIVPCFDDEGNELMDSSILFAACDSLEEAMQHLSEALTKFTRMAGPDVEDDEPRITVVLPEPDVTIYLPDTATTTTEDV